MYLAMASRSRSLNGMERTFTKSPPHCLVILILFISIPLFLSPVHGEDTSLSFTDELPPTKKPDIPWGRDPFVPAIRGVRAPGMRLVAIFYNKERPSAIIDNRIVYIGSVIDGQKVIDIREGHVILQGKEGRIRLEIADIAGISDERK